MMPRIICAVAAALALFMVAANAMDPMDRKMEMEMNRDRAESRIDRLKEDQRNRAKDQKKTKKRRGTYSKQRPLKLQY